MDDAQHFGRTADGTKEILSKSGRLTQSERLVLIVISEPTSVERLILKLPSLTPDRVRRAIRRLLELGLVYELLLDPDKAEAVEPLETIPVVAMQDFLRQSEADPVSQVVSGDELSTSMRMHAFADSVWVASPHAAATRDEAVPLSSVFKAKAPQEPVRHVPPDELEQIARARIRADIAARRAQRERQDRSVAEARIRQLEESFGRSLGRGMRSTRPAWSTEPARVRHIPPRVRGGSWLTTGVLLFLLALAALFGAVSALVALLHL
ncbi:hypothetical protein [Derxia gummosa]|uniref:Uncharacterized protein n=1 Tax=Derxia gummosa DSM 723 TaxID=1121388 RepID=A0A8B6X547_9BURK|nr:hypothetical protein [Derxia gummosa]